MARSGFYTPGLGGGDGFATGYGGSQQWSRSPFVQDSLDPEIPQGVYTAFLAQNGLGGLDRRSQWARGLYGQTQSGYQAAARENPAMDYRTYLAKQFGTTGLDKMWRELAPSQRGESPSMWAQPNRLISWG